MRWLDRLTLLLGAASPFAFSSDLALAAGTTMPQDARLDGPPEAQKDLLLFTDPAQREKLFQLAGHRSHSSHSSHRSHVSGSGHSSHYSGSYVAPIYTPPPSPPTPVVKPAPKPKPLLTIPQAKPRTSTAPKTLFKTPYVTPDKPYLAETAPAVEASPPVTATTPVPPTSPIEIRAKPRLTQQELKDFIMRVQIALIFGGYDPGPVDGTLNEKTVAALKEMQGTNGLEVTGYMDIKTLRVLGVVH